MRNLNQPLQVYDRLEEQDRYKESCKGSYEIMSPGTTLIPFQIAVPFGAAVIDYFKIRGSYAYQPIVADNVGKFAIVTDAINKSWFVYSGLQLVFTAFDGSKSPMVLQPGYYWFEVSIDGRVYYTEMFHVNGNSVCEKPVTMILESWSESNINGYYFGNDFRFRSYHNCFITDDTPDITDEYTKDGYERNDLQRRVIQYNKTIDLDPIPNAGAIGISALTTFKNFVIKHNGNNYQPTWVNYAQEKIEGGCNDLVKLTFSLSDEDLIKKYCDQKIPPYVPPIVASIINWNITELAGADYVDVNLQIKVNDVIPPEVDGFSTGSGSFLAVKGDVVSVQTYSIDPPNVGGALGMIVNHPNGITPVEDYNDLVPATAGANLIFSFTVTEDLYNVYAFSEKPYQIIFPLNGAN